MNAITQHNVALQQVAHLQHLFELNIQKGNCIDDSVHLLDQMQTIAPHTGVEHDVLHSIINNYITLLHVHGIQSSDESLQYIHNLARKHGVVETIKSVSSVPKKNGFLSKIWPFALLLLPVYIMIKIIEYMYNKIKKRTK